jgi:hypothetical protein
MNDRERVEQLEAGGRSNRFIPMNTSGGAVCPVTKGRAQTLTAGREEPLDLRKHRRRLGQRPPSLVEKAGYRRIDRSAQIVERRRVDAHPFRSLILALIVLGVAAGCSDAPEKAEAEVIEGVVIDVRSASLGDVESFTLKDGDETYEVLIDAERDYGFPVSHLSEHILSADPVRVELESRGDRLYARSIEDAG